MLIVFFRRWICILAFFSQTGPAQAQELLDQLPDGNDHVWDCWVSSSNERIESYFIRCIRDREIPPASPTPDSPQAVLLDLVHERIHRGETAENDNDLHAGRLNEILDHIWRIKIHQYPSDYSWEQEYPQMLVQMMCRQTADCAVLLFR